MKNQILKQVTGVPIKAATYGVERRTSRQYLPDAAGQYHISSQGATKSKGNFVLERMNLIGKKAGTFAHGVREHVRLGPKISETVKGKLREGEKLLKACQCYLSTTAGPIAGLLFISSEKVAFCSERSIKIPCPNGEYVRVHYKVVVPVEKIKRVNQSENMKKPCQKYMEIVTVDGFDIWLMGFLNYQKAFKCLQQAISQRLDDVDTF
ncbi:hypothetical protein GOBAR_DD07419 [Gossypium barbadense]|nr:hypothetical protein GOBAR_DD07419 [Gossypium barbadense]